MEEHFAALKLLDADNDHKLTRTISYSELPSSRRICIEESYYSGNPSSLVRQYSCEQMFGKTTNSRQFNNENEWQTIGPSSNFVEPANWQFCKSNNIIHTPKFILPKQSSEIGCKETKNMNMLKDSKFSLRYSSTNTNISDEREHLLCSEPKNTEKAEQKQFNVTNDNNRGTYEDIKKKFRPLAAKKKSLVKKKGNMCCYSFLCLCMFPIVMAIFAIFLNLDSFMICNHTMLFSNASLELQQKIYGQGHAISNIVSFLNTDTFYVKVLCLIGGTGVGKSYTAEIIARNFPYKDEIFVYDRILEDTIDTNALNSSRSDALLIMENLKMKDLDFFSDAMNLLSKNKNKCITVLAIFNVKSLNNYLGKEADSVDNENAINKVFVDKNIKFLVVPYKPLNEQILEMCITEIARNSNMSLTQSQINIIKQSLLFFGSGCKGAYSKVQVIGRE
ncbi:uncharacterized protein LOC117607525 [Osmia lignaria lignaria]|uniref:uncharacterized protein LOC117607525 n=1 Tax=Osmia lignaria lignaria TaxID=1437193 RepID=UPI00402BDB79